MKSASAEHVFYRPFRVEGSARLPARVEIEATDVERIALAMDLGLLAVESFAATFTVESASRGRIHVMGAVDAQVSRECVVSLDPFDVDMHEPVDLYFAPAASDRRTAASSGRVEAQVRLDEDPPEPLVDGVIDLGEIAREHIALGLEPYPRKPGVEFAPAAPAEHAAPSPFEVLRARRSGGEGGRGD